MGAAEGNATQAARLAGYKGNDRTIAQVGKENLRKPTIAKAIRDLVLASPEVADRKERQAFWTAVMRDSKASMRDRLKASEILGKTQQDFVTKVELGGKGGAPAKLEVVFVKPEVDDDGD